MEYVYMILVVGYFIFFAYQYLHILMLKKQLVLTHQKFLKTRSIDWDQFSSNAFSLKDVVYLLAPLPRPLENNGNNIYQHRQVYQKMKKLKKKRKRLFYSVILFAAMLYTVYHVDHMKTP